jgi:hypothetical protein
MLTLKPFWPDFNKFYMEQESSLLIFTGLLNASLLVWLFIYYYILIFMPTALLICMENTFWNINRDGNFVELFKKSFTLYVESGMRKKMETVIDILRNQGGHLATTGKKFKAKFCKTIIVHFLCKFHYLYLHLTNLTILNTAQPGNTVHPASGDQAFESEQKNEKKFACQWLQNLMLKFHKGQRV